MLASLQRKCRCNGSCGDCSKEKSHVAPPSSQRAIATPSRGHDFSRIPATASVESFNDDPDAGKQPAPKPSTSPSTAPSTPPTTKTKTLPCPTSVSLGTVLQFNHSNLSTADQDAFGTYLGAVARMDVGPGPDHRGHWLAEDVKLVSNDCPKLTHPCRGGASLAINGHKTGAGDPRTGNLLKDSPTSTIDRHITASAQNLLGGSGKSSCKSVCSQVYHCDDAATGPLLTGSFTITRDFVAKKRTKADGTPMDYTTGTVTKK